MAMELSWSLDYCLACDKQTQGDAYCSQSCRLADFEASTWSGPTSPTSTSPSTNANKGSGFYLSPAINFTAYKTSNTPCFQASQTPSNQSLYSPHPTSKLAATTKRLTPSSSSSSLSSTQSVTSHLSPQAGPLSEATRNELLGYTNSFDNVRNWKRRMTWS